MNNVQGKPVAASNPGTQENTQPQLGLTDLLGSGPSLNQQECILNSSLQEFELLRSAIINNRSMPTTVFVHGEVILGGSMTPQDSYELVNTYCSKDYAELEVKSMKMAYSDGRLICKGDNFSLGRPV